MTFGTFGSDAVVYAYDGALLGTQSVPRWELMATAVAHLRADVDTSIAMFADSLGGVGAQRWRIGEALCRCEGLVGDHLAGVEVSACLYRCMLGQGAH